MKGYGGNPDDALFGKRGSLSRLFRHQSRPLCRILLIGALASRSEGCVGRRRETSRCVARTADVSEMCPRVLLPGNSKVPICRHFI
jgi:hypothetical protein